MRYHFTTVEEIDHETRDYLEFVTPTPLENLSVDEINLFLTRIDECYEELTLAHLSRTLQ